jgi:hypothetical protein
VLFRWHRAGACTARSDLDQAIASPPALAALQASNLSRCPRTSICLPANECAVFGTHALQKSGTPGNSAGAQGYLVEARDAVEMLKARELQDYFRDSCVAEARTRVKALVQNIGPGTAVLYPIVLPDRLELPQPGLRLTPTVVVKESTVVETARQFREAVPSQRTRLAGASPLPLVDTSHRTKPGCRTGQNLADSDHSLRANDGRPV